MCIRSRFDVTARALPIDDINVRVNTGIIVLDYVIPAVQWRRTESKRQKNKAGPSFILQSQSIKMTMLARILRLI